MLNLVIGSEGTLAVITELTMKLIPNPKVSVSFILPFENIEAAIESVPSIKLAGLNPQSIEFMERDIVDSSANFTGATIFSQQLSRIKKLAPTFLSRLTAMMKMKLCREPNI